MFVVTNYRIFGRLSKLIQKNVFRRDFSSHKLTPKQFTPRIKSIAVIGGGIITVSLVWRTNRAKCDLSEDSVTDTLEERTEDLKAITESLREERFDFKRLWSFVKPDVIYLLIAVSVI